MLHRKRRDRAGASPWRQRGALTPVVLELGGKDPGDRASTTPTSKRPRSAAVWGAFANSGQACASGRALLSHERVALRSSRARVAEITRALSEQRAGTHAGRRTSARCRASRQLTHR
ncbi:MAG: aldehyde dehydrogenase family protein [Pyrinomonadaceae bacterium]